LNIVIPMAGQGIRFSRAGYDIPKPLIDVQGQAMIQKAVESLDVPGKYIFVVLQEHLDKFPYLESLLLSLVPNSEVIITKQITDGPARTCLLAKRLIDNDHPLLIANCDQIMNWDGREFLKFCQSTPSQGIIATYNSDHPKNSFVQFDKNGNVTGIIEKVPISNIATIGIYWWMKGKYFVEAAASMIALNETYNNEFYVGPAYNQLLKKNGFTVSCYHVEQPFLVGTPEDLERYLQAV